MPFQVSGMIKGKMYQEEVLSAKEIATLFDIKVSEPRATFKMSSNFRKFDHLNGIEQHSRGFRLNPKIVANFEGDTIEIQYFTSRRNVRRGNNNVTVFDPPRVDVFRQMTEHDVDMVKDLELATFMYLYPKHGKSPLYDGKIVYYEIHSRSEQAKAENATMDKFLDLFTSLKDMPKEKLLIKAKGINIKGNQIQVTKHMSKDELVRSISAFAMQHQGQFYQEFNNHISDFKGTIDVAMDMGILVKTKLQGNVDAWAFGKEYGGAKIVEIRGGIDPKSALQEAINKDFATLFSKIESYVFGSIEAVTETEIAEKMASRTQFPQEGIDIVLDRFDALKKEGIIKIEKAKVYVAGEYVVPVGDPAYKTKVAEYILAHPEILQPA